MDWIDLGQNRDMWPAVLNTVMNINPYPTNVENRVSS